MDGYTELKTPKAFLSAVISMACDRDLPDSVFRARVVRDAYEILAKVKEREKDAVQDRGTPLQAA